jgi:predicted aspartyl protease
MTAAGETVPQPAQVNALIDTGASGSAIARGIAQKLGLQPVGVIAVNTPSGTSQMTEYAVRIGFGPVAFDAVVIESELAVQGIEALLGRDVLSMGVFIYHGRLNEFTLAY